MSKVLVSSDARRACSRGVCGGAVGGCLGGASSNPVEESGRFFPSCYHLYLLSLF